MSNSSDRKDLTPSEGRALSKSAPEKQRETHRKVREAAIRRRDLHTKG